MTKWNSAELIIAIAEILREIEPPRRDAVDRLKQEIRTNAQKANAPIGNVGLAYLFKLLEEIRANFRNKTNQPRQVPHPLN